MRRRAIVLLAVSAFLASCGGDGGNRDGGNGGDVAQPRAAGQGGEITREEYIARADRLCEAANQRARAFNKRIEDAQADVTTAEEQLDAVAPVLKEGYEVQRRDNEAFRDVKPPSADREIIARFQTARDEHVALVGRVLDAAESGDAERFQALVEETHRVKERARALAEGYGFKECGGRAGD